MPAGSREGLHMIIETVTAIILSAMPYCLVRGNDDVRRLKALLHRVFFERELQREIERERIARELHDSVCQLLIATKHSLELARERPEQREFFLERGLDQLCNAITETRNIAHDMKSVLLDNSEFSQALETLCCDFGEGAQIRTECTIADQSIDRTLPASTTSALIRITQEALTNVGKHAHASLVKVSVGTHANHVGLRVVDNGRGFRSPIAGLGYSPPTGIGLDNMRKRATALGGSLSARDIGRGTEICARLPLTGSTFN
jgi:two-component system, NarL family, sensor kinase